MSVIFGPGIGMQPAQGSLVDDTNAADQAPVVVQATDTQSGNLMEFRSPSGTLLSAVDVNGAMGGGSGLAGAVILAPASAGRNTIQPTADAVEGLIIKGHSATQSAALLNLEISAGNSVFSIDPKGFTYIQSQPSTDSLRIDSAAGSHAINCVSQDANSFGNTFQVNDTGLGTLVKILGSLNETALRILQFPATAQDLVQLCDNASLVYWRMTSGWVQKMSQKSSTNVPQVVGSITPDFLDNTNATWKGRLILKATDSAGDREAIRVEANGTAPLIGFLGANAVVRQTNGTAADLAAIADAPAKAFVTALSTALVNLGLLNAPA